MTTETPSKENKIKRPNVAKKHRVVLKNFEENGGNMSKAIADSGLYSDSMVKNPQKITESKTFQEILEEDMPDALLSTVHKSLLNATHLDHMTFPLGPRTSKEKEKWVAEKIAKAIAAGKSADSVEQDVLSDEDIGEMLAEVNCKLRKVVHGETARHVYFWAYDNMARDKALDKGYKLKGRYGNEGVPPPRGNTYNFIFSAEAQQQIKNLEGGLKKLFIQPHAKED